MRVIKKFNLKQALDGNPIMTQDQDTCNIIAYVPEFDNGKRLLVQQHSTGSRNRKVTLAVREYCDNGKYRIDGKSSPYDLIMDIVEETKYVNLYKDGTSAYFDTEEVADYVSCNKDRIGKQAYPVKTQINL
jgi:primase-polymerase (primpol)-like protein